MVGVSPVFNSEVCEGNNVFNIKYSVCTLASWSWQYGDLIVHKKLDDGRTGGTLTMYFEQDYNQFIPFCITSFNDRAAELVCNQLGYSYVQQYGTVGNMR